MTKEQAAKILRQGSKMAWDAEEFCEAYDMAIKALEQQPIAEERYQDFSCNVTTEEIAQSFREDVEAVKDYLPKCNSMEFPKTFDEFANDYGFTDDKEIYTNGSHLIPVFRVRQWLDHIEQQPSDDCISREFIRVKVEYPPEDLCIYPEYKGKPYFSIEYKENNEDIVGYGTYNSDVLSEWLKEYFIQKPVNTTSDDCVSRADLLKIYENRFIELQKAHQTDKQLGVNWCINTLKDMPPVTPTHGTCKDCKYCEDIGIKGTFYCKRYGINHLDKYYCADFEKRGNENGSN